MMSIFVMQLDHVCCPVKLCVCDLSIYHLITERQIFAMELNFRKVPVSSLTIACSQEGGRDWLDCHAGCQEVSRYHTRGESLETCYTYASAKHEQGYPHWL